MSDYKMEIVGGIGLSDYSNIYDYIGVVENNDNFTIVMEHSSKEGINIVQSMLLDGNFNVIEQGYDCGGRYFINAHKNK